MDSTDTFRRERWKLSGSWSATPRIIAALIGAALGALTPGNPTRLQATVFTILKAVGGILVVECGHFLIRYIWVAPGTIYRAAQQRQQTYVDRINGLLNDIAKLNVEKQALEAQLQQRQQDQEFANLLTERYTFGLNEIMNWSELQKDPNQFTQEDYAALNERERVWTAGVRQLLEQHGCSPQVIAHFWSIHEVPYNQFHHYHHVSHVLSMFSERLKRLKSIINEYAEVKILKN